MFKNTNKEERKTFKEVLAENKGKIIAGATIVTVGAVGIILYKQHQALKLLGEISKVDCDIDELQGKFNREVTDYVREMTDQFVVVRDIAKEGALEEAIASVKRKIQYRVGKIADLNNRPLDNDAMISKELYEKELEILKKKLTTFEQEWENMLH